MKFNGFGMPVDKAVEFFSIAPREDFEVTEEDADILKNGRRRGIIKQLSIGAAPSALEGPVLISMDLTDLSERVAAAEKNKIPEELEQNEKNSVRTTLYQNHIPRLEEEGWITYDSEEGIVHPEPVLTEKSAEMMAVEGVLDGDNGYQELYLRHGEPRTDIHGTGTDLDVDDFYDAISNTRRRMALEYLSLDYTDPDYQEISEMIAAVENEKLPSQLTSTERKNVLVQMYQNHLPKLDDYDIIEFDKRAQDEVMPSEHFDIVSPRISEDIPEEVIHDTYETAEDNQTRYESIVASFSL